MVFGDHCWKTGILEVSNLGFDQRMSFSNDFFLGFIGCQSHGGTIFLILFDYLFRKI